MTMKPSNKVILALSFFSLLRSAKCASTLCPRLNATLCSPSKSSLRRVNCGFLGLRKPKNPTRYTTSKMKGANHSVGHPLFVYMVEARTS